MHAVLVMLALLVAGPGTCRAEDAHLPPGALHLSTRDIAGVLGTPAPPAAAADPLASLLEHWKRREIGWRPLLTLLPSGLRGGAAGEPPIFALVARACGRTIVSLTKPRRQTDPGQRVLLQRTLISDLLEGRQFSLTVYEDHTLSESATRLVGVGAQVTLRPSVTFLGWRLRLELYGSFAPDAGATAYATVSGRLQAPPLVRPVPLP